MSDPSIFNEQNGSTTNGAQTGGTGTPTNSQPNDQIATLLSNIRNESGEPKYRTVEDGIKALQHSQTFIDQLKQEIQSTKLRLEQAEGVASKVTTLEQAVQDLIKGTNQQSTATPEQKVDESSLAAVVERVLSSKTAQQKRDENVSKVVNELQSKFGTEASTKFYEKANELGMSKAEINELAAKSPTAVFQLFGLGTTQKQPNVAPNTSTVNTTGFQQNTDSFIRANSKSTLIGATTQEVMQESMNARKMVDELHAQGKTVSDLTNPKVFFQTFKRG